MATIEDNIRQTSDELGEGLAGPAYASLQDVLRRRAEQFGDRRAYTFKGKEGDETTTFAELDLKARRIGATLQQTVERGDRVLLLFDAGLDFVAAFFGCLYAGVLAVPTTYPKPRRPMPRLATIARDCDAVAVLTDSATLSTLDGSLTGRELPDMKWIAVDSIDADADKSLVEAKVEPNQLAFLQYTSGSTSDPKGVMVSHANLLHNLETIRQGFGLRSAEDGGEIQTGVFWLPAYHDMGLVGGILETLYVGGHSVLMSPAAFLQRPIGWLELMSVHRAAISGAPNFAYELCANRSTHENRAALDLGNWKVAFCGAEPIRPGTLRQFAKAFAVSGFRESSFYPCFGLAEGTLLAAGGRGPSELTICHVKREPLAKHRVEISTDAIEGETQPLVGCGTALCGQEIAIVDPESFERCDPQSVGEIWIKGPSIANGYWGNSEETRQCFQATIAGTSDDSFLRTGDLGFFAKDNLYVTGRVKDVIIIRGRNHYPQDLERTAGSSHEALRQDSGAVFAIHDADSTEQLVVVHEVDRKYRKADFDEVIRCVRRAIAEVHELDVYAVVLIRHMSLPRTTSGKVQRHHCRNQFESNEFKLLAEWKRQLKPVPDAESGTSDGVARLEREDRPMTPDEIDRLSERVESWLLNWLVERAAIPPSEVHRDKPFAEYGLDSMTAVELSQELEDWLGVEVVATVAWNYPTPATLSTYLAREAGGANQMDAKDAAVPSTPLDDEFAKMLAEIESLSDEDAASLLDDETKN